MSYKRLNVAEAVGVQLSLIITPMLDMSFQILAFFIMTYHPSALEGHIPGSLTAPERHAINDLKNAAIPSELLPPIDEKDLPAELDGAITVHVKSVVKGQEAALKRAVGSPVQFFVRSALDPAAELIEGSDDVDFRIALERLEDRLRQIGGKGSKANLRIAADGGLRYQYVLMVYDAAKRAGFEKIHFVPPPIKSKLNTK